ncbi:MAG: hypothetical protein M3041_00095 [Acidobacteriota bacterium]|nr:hypothetical protein [Acidobacteriota bacterium]
MIDLTVDDILAQAPCPACSSTVRPDDVQRNRLIASCSRCEWHGSAALPKVTKTIIYLDSSTLSHLASARVRGDQSSPWIALHEQLRSAVAQNVICCPSSPVVDYESELSERVSRPVRELSRSLGEVRFRYPAVVEERQLLRAFRLFLDGQPPQVEYSPPFSDVSDDDPNEWPPYLRFNSLFHATTAELEQRREGKTSVRNRVEEIFLEYGSQSLSFDDIRAREALGIGASVRQCGPLWRFLEMAKRRFDTFEAWQKMDAFLASEHAVVIPTADVTSRLYALVAKSFSSRSSRRPAASDAQDIEHIGTYLPYVDILIADRFFAQRVNETLAGLQNYRGRVYSLGEKQIDAFADHVKDLCSNATHAEFADLVYREIGIHGSTRRFMNRLIAVRSASGG